MERWEKFQGVYIHTPFCLQKCLYCDFPSYAGFSEEVRQLYVEALCGEIEFCSRKSDLSVSEGATVYFGGGTPTVLSAEQLGQIVNCLKQCGFWKDPAEATIEANPGTVERSKMKSLRQLGFDRISLGVQSLQDNELRALGRIHTAEQALRALEEAKQAGFQRINADLISGIPCQTVESFRNTLDRILQMDLPHLSVYSLILEEGTPLERLVEEGKVELPDEESSFHMYEMTTDCLEKAGLKRYEISNYAKPGQESLHNKVYWHYEPYAAFGVGACAFTGKERRTNTLDVRKYIKGWSTPGSSLHDNGLWEAERLDRKTQISEAVIMGLRLTSGVDLTILKRRFDTDIMEYYEKEMQTLLDKKMAEYGGGMLRLTPYGMRYGNQAFEAFV